MGQRSGLATHLHRHNPCGGRAMGLPQVDADWHAFCQAIYKGVEGVGAKSLQRVWEGPCLLERDVALSGSVGCCGIAHDCQHLECPEEVRAVRRALLLPFFFKEPVVIKASLSNCGIQETCGGMPAQIVLIGATTTVTGQEASVHLPLRYTDTTWKVSLLKQNWSGEMVALFLEDWQLAPVALSCHPALECQGSSLSQCTEASLTLEGLQQYGEECDGRTAKACMRISWMWEGSGETWPWRFSLSFVGSVLEPRRLQLKPH